MVVVWCGGGGGGDGDGDGNDDDDDDDVDYYDDDGGGGGGGATTSIIIGMRTLFCVRKTPAHISEFPLHRWPVWKQILYAQLTST